MPDRPVAATLADLDDWSKFEFVPVSDMYADRFQRPLNERWLAARDGKFSKALFGTVTLSVRSKRSKHHSIVDGQHRKELAERHDSGLVVPAVVFTDLTIELEALLFSAFQRERRAIRPMERFQADLVAKEPRALSIEKIVADEQFELTADAEGPKLLKAIRTLEKIYDEDPSMMRRVLTLIRETWASKGYPFSSSEWMLKGVWYFLQENNDVDEQKFIERLGGVTPSTLGTRARQLREARNLSGTVPTFVAEAIENEYRSRRVRR